MALAGLARGGCAGAMGADQAGTQLNAHHGLAAHEVVLLLETDPADGLGEAEARRRREHFGPNVLPSARRMGPLARLLSQLHHPLIYVLLVAGAVTLALRENVDAAVIFGVVAGQRPRGLRAGVQG